MQELDNLKKQMSKCDLCDLCLNRKQIVFDNGNPKAKIMLVGEAPGEDENEQGIPFVGKAGQKLDSMLKFAGLSRKDVWIANTVLCWPPSNRKPTYKEMEACRWRLNKEIELVKPKLIIALGKTALEQLLNEQIKEPLNKFFPINGLGNLKYKLGKFEARVICTYHPSFILRSPEKGYKDTLPHWTAIKEFVECSK